MTNFWIKRQYSESSTEPDGLAKRGYIYLLSEFFTVPDSSTIHLGNQDTVLHLNLGWSEGEPNTPGLWETVP